MASSTGKYYIIGRHLSYTYTLYFAEDILTEHMEADENTPESLPPWVMLEYTHILERTYSKDHQNTVLYSNLSSTSASSLQSKMDNAATSSSSSQLPRSKVQCLSDSIEKVTGQGDIPPASRICLLDPRAEKAISPEDAQLFDGFLFGGILGDDPPRDRTKELRKLGYEGRHLGSVQMTTDTACYVSIYGTHTLMPTHTDLLDIPF